VWVGMDVPVGREPTVEQYQQIPLHFPHAERPPVVSGSTAQAFQGVDEALAAVEAALAAHPRPGGEVVEDFALQGVAKALDVGSREQVFDPFTVAPSISARRRMDSQKRFQDALLDHVGPPPPHTHAHNPQPPMPTHPLILSSLSFIYYCWYYWCQYHDSYHYLLHYFYHYRHSHNQ
jgi:hypothetical protein